MNESDLVKENTCCVSGHRDIDVKIENKLKSVFIQLIKNGIDTFLIGMAIGFDSVCFKVLEKIRNKYPIKIVACIPCKNQAERFAFKDKREYRREIESADGKFILGDFYTPYCMMNRNMFMVDNSSVLVCYLVKSKGGTKNTVKYAERQNINIINIAEI